MTRRTLIAILVAAGLGVLMIAGRPRAQNTNELDVQFHSFQDTRGVTVLSPSVDLAKDFTDRSTLRVTYGVDAISAASDSCVRCHRDGVRSHRQVASLSVTQKYNDWHVTFGGAFSKENFYRATTGLTSISRDLNNANTTVAGGYSFSLNQPMLHPLPDYQNQYQHDLNASVTQTLTKTTIAQVGYEFEHLSGYLSNPYLRADVGGIMVVGQVPDIRSRQTIMLRLRQALPADTYLEADYRHYVDDWKLTSNGVSIGLSHHFSPQVLAAFNYRYYDQTAAYFWAPQYFAPIPQYFTADFRLEPFASGEYTSRVVITPQHQLPWLPPQTGVVFEYNRYVANNNFTAGIFSAGLRIPLGSGK